MTNESEPLIHIDAFKEEIYADFVDMEEHSDSLPPDQSAKWGEYSTKPVAQTQWENLVKTSIAELTAEPSRVHRNYDLRPYVKDTLTNTWLLVDSGAACTIMPVESCENPVANPFVKLHAVNNTQIDTFGVRKVTYNIGGKQYTHKATVANVKTGILGFDFLAHHKLDIIWVRNKCFLQGVKGRVPLKLDHSEQPSILAPVQFESFQKALSPTPT